jgi:hypothetical protein
VDDEVVIKLILLFTHFQSGDEGDGEIQPYKLVKTPTRREEE